jgi:hypothetical protein
LAYPHIFLNQVIDEGLAIDLLASHLRASSLGLEHISQSTPQISDLYGKIISNEMGVLTVCMTPACLRLVDVKLKHPTGIEPASNQQESSFQDVGYPVLITALAVKTTSHSIEPYGKRA